MKIFFRFFLLTLLLPVRCLAKDSTEVVFIKSLPAEGILLDKGWKEKGQSLLFIYPYKNHQAACRKKSSYLYC